MNNDITINLMPSAVYELHALVDKEIIELKNELLEVDEPEEILAEIRQFRAIRNRLANYL